MNCYIFHLSLAIIHRWESNKVTPTKKDLVIFDEFCKKCNIFFDGGSLKNE